MPSLCSPLKPPHQLLLQAIRPRGLLHLHWRGSTPLFTRALSITSCTYSRRNPPQTGYKLLESLIIAQTRFQSFQRLTFATMSSQDRDVLPDTVKPINYNIELFKLELGPGFAFHGAVTIEVNIKAPVGEITLNSHELIVKSATIDGKDVQGMSSTLNPCTSHTTDVVQQETFRMIGSRSGSLWAFNRRSALRRRLCTSSTKEP